MKKLAILVIGCTFISGLLANGCLSVALPVIVDYVVEAGLLGS